MTKSAEFNQFLARAGVPLAALGIREVGLSRVNALKAIELLRRSGLPALGGDVYLRRANRIVPANANWYAEPKPSEDHLSYQRRSWRKAETYIEAFPEPAGAEPLFSIVAGKEG
jgi:hypothetical protein